MDYSGCLKLCAWWEFSLSRHFQSIVEVGYLLFCGRTRKMTQYAATAVADIDPDSARLLLGYFLWFAKCDIIAEQWTSRARVIERSSWGSHLISHQVFCQKAKKEGSPFGEPLVAEMGFEPHDLRVMSPTSCQTAPLRDIMVPEAGVEPVRDKISRDFKSRASANSAIPASATVCSYTLLNYYSTMHIKCQYLFCKMSKKFLKRIDNSPKMWYHI